VTCIGPLWIHAGSLFHRTDPERPALSSAKGIPARFLIKQSCAEDSTECVFGCSAPGFTRPHASSALVQRACTAGAPSHLAHRPQACWRHALTTAAADTPQAAGGWTGARQERPGVRVQVGFASVPPPIHAEQNHSPQALCPARTSSRRRSRCAANCIDCQPGQSWDTQIPGDIALNDTREP